MRLIDADALFTKQKSHADLFKGSDKHDDIIRRDEATMALAEIQNAPTIEAETERHGRWNYRHEDDWCYCTACGTDAEGSDGECLLTDYCPHCGARMDERGADNG